MKERVEQRRVLLKGHEKKRKYEMQESETEIKKNMVETEDELKTLPLWTTLVD